MSEHERAHERLRAANPAPLTAIEDRPDAVAFLAAIELHETAAPERARPPWKRGALIAAAAFAVTLLVGVALWLATLAGDEPDVVDPPSSTTTSTAPTTEPPPPTTEPPPTTTTTTTTIAPSALEALDLFAVRYSSGDVDALLELLTPGLIRTTIRDADPPFPWDAELLRRQLDMDAALNTTLELQSCRQLSSGTLTCLATRDNDLTRIAAVGPQQDRWSLQFENGKVSSWTIVIAFNETPYQALAVRPFTTWLAEAHPEIPDPYPTTGGVSHWLRDVDIVDQTAELISEYAADRGVTLP